MLEVTQAILEVAGAIRRKSRNSALINGGIFLVGLVITLATVNSAMKAGGVYVVFWGAILFGFIQCVRAIVRYIKADDEAAMIVALHIRRSTL